MKTDILTDLLGSLTLVNYIVAFIFVLLTLIVKWIWKTVDSVKNDNKTPKKFSWSFWFEDNIKHKLLSFIGNLIAVFILLRFSIEIIGVSFSYILAVGIGFALDAYVDKLKKMQKIKKATKK